MLLINNQNVFGISIRFKFTFQPASTVKLSKWSPHLVSVVNRFHFWSTSWPCIPFIDFFSSSKFRLLGTEFSHTVICCFSIRFSISEVQSRNIPSVTQYVFFSTISYIIITVWINTLLFFLDRLVNWIIFDSIRWLPSIMKWKKL